MNDPLELFLADYEDRLGRWHHQGDMHERGLILTKLIRAYRKVAEENAMRANGAGGLHNCFIAGHELQLLINELPTIKKTEEVKRDG